MGMRMGGVRPVRPFSYEEAVKLLVSRGLDEDAIRLGSIPESTLKFAGEAIARHGPRRPLRALHVGNFVGVSLAGLSAYVARHHSESVVVSVDPNLHHLGVRDPQHHTLALLDHFGLQRNNIVICGYSLDRSANETPVGTFADEPAGEDTLTNLERLGHRFDVAMVDGNHDQDYLRRELEVLVRLLSEGALLMLDDVSTAHPHIRDLFDELANDRSWPLEEVGQDGRLGILAEDHRNQASSGDGERARPPG